MAALASAAVGVAASRAVAARKGDCRIGSWANVRRGTCALQKLGCGQSSLKVQCHNGNFGAFRSHGRSRSPPVVLASKEDIPSEILEEDSKFVPISEDDPRFGPPAILLLGFTNEEAIKVQDLLEEMEGDFMQVLLCTEEMAKGTLGTAIDAVQPDLMEVKVAKGLPRISFLSGLTGEEIMMVIKIFPEAGVGATVFAAHVPLNSSKSMAHLIEEIMDDHQRLSKQVDDVEEQTES